MKPTSKINTRNNTKAIAWALFALTVAVFSPALRFDQTGYDDNIYVFENQHVTGGLDWPAVRYAFTTTDGGSWMPITWLSLMLDTTVFGTNPFGYRLTNILLHSASAALLFLLLARVSALRLAAFWIAAAFALHPLRTESVAWIAERKDVLSGFFMLLGLLAYTVSHKGWNKSMTVTLWMLLGLMSKPMLVTFPFVLLLFDWLFPCENQLRVGGQRAAITHALRSKIHFFVIVGIFAVLTFVTQKRSGAVVDLDDGIQAKVVQSASNHGFYISKILWPSNRAVVYPEDTAPLLVKSAWLCALVILTVIAWLSRRRHPWITFGWFWFLITLLPVNGLVRVGMTPVADRYTYIPSIGIFIILGLGWANLHWVDERSRKLARIAGAIAIAAMAVLTIRDLPRWRNAGTLFEAAVKNHPTKIALNNLAYHYIGERRVDEARALCDRAIQLDPLYAQSYANRSLALALVNDYESAKSDYDQSVKLGARPIQRERLYAMLPDLRNVRLPEMRSPEEAWHVFAITLGLTPRTSHSFASRAEMRSHWGDAEGAIADYSRAVALSPENPTNYLGRAAIQFKARNWNEAWRDIGLCRTNGGSPPEDFIRALKEASGFQR